MLTLLAVENPLLELGSELPFDRIRAEHVESGLRALLADAEARLATLERSPDNGYEGTFGELERATERLELALSVVEHLETTRTTAAFRAAYNAVLPDTSAFFSSIPLRELLYRRLSDFAASAERKELSPTRERFVQKTLAEFKRHGATLSPANKERLRELGRELSVLTARFAQNVLDATNAFELVIEDEAKLSGLPASALEAARDSAKRKGRQGFRLTLQGPSVLAVLGYADDGALRETIWRAYSSRGGSSELDNRPIVNRILTLRQQRAKLLGFRDFADLVSEERMAKTGQKAQSFVDELTEKTEPAFQRENAELLAFRRELEGTNAPELAPWDVSYYSEKLKRARYAFDDEQLKPYFSFDTVLRGAFELAERLYQVRIEEAQGLSVWDGAVRAFRIFDTKRQKLATFYVDPYPREDKRGGAWMYGLLAAVPPEPHIAVFCANLPPPSGGKPALLAHRDVITIFHELGHLLHHCLSRVEVRSLSGTRVVLDFVELPSQIMENWCTEREGLSLFARHYETGAPIPDALLDRLRAARTFRAANLQMRELGLASLDLGIHRDYEPEPDGDPLRYGNRILKRYFAAGVPDDYGFLLGFLHLFSEPVGYAAGYYSYKWAQVLDADAFGRFRAEGVLSPVVGAEFRDRVLAQGDSRDPTELFVHFMGREPRLDALLERLGLSA
jgi:oligopeptidase A